MKIIKVINNNTVSVIDDKGKEQIISGKGIGFGKNTAMSLTRIRFRKCILSQTQSLEKGLSSV